MTTQWLTCERVGVVAGGRYGGTPGTPTPANRGDNYPSMYLVEVGSVVASLLPLHFVAGVEVKQALHSFSPKRPPFPFLKARA